MPLGLLQWHLQQKVNQVDLRLDAESFHMPQVWPFVFPFCQLERASQSTPFLKEGFQPFLQQQVDELRQRRWASAPILVSKSAVSSALIGSIQSGRFLRTSC